MRMIRELSCASLSPFLRGEGAVRRLFLISLGWIIGLATPALAQPLSLADLATYAAPDRTQKLLEIAKAEGGLNVYSSLTSDDLAVLSAAFEKKAGIKPQFWRASNEDVLQRGVTEEHSGRHSADLFDTGAAGLEGLRRESLLHPVASPVFAELMPQAIAPGVWTGTRLQIISAAYNTNLIASKDLPTSYADFVDPRWKGKLTVETDDIDWFATLVTSMGEDKGVKLLQDIVAANGVTLRKGHSLIANLVAAGEAPLAITTYYYKVAQMKQAGAPVDTFNLDPTVARVDGIGLSNNAPHPASALLYMDFLLGEGQAILAGREFFPTNVKAAKSIPDMNIVFSDAGKQIDDGVRWTRLFNETFGRRAR